MVKVSAAEHFVVNLLAYMFLDISPWPHHVRRHAGTWTVSMSTGGKPGAVVARRLRPDHHKLNPRDYAARVPAWH